MNIKLNISVLKWVIFGTSAALLIGGALDMLSNSVVWISPRITYYGSGTLFVLGLILIVLEKRKIINFLNKDGGREKNFDWYLIAGMLGILVVLWVPRFIAPKVEIGTVVQHQIVQLPSTREYSVYYPRPFKSTPNLTFSHMVDGIYCHPEYKLTDQRPDGFVIAVNATSVTCVIEWFAEGILSD